MLHQSYELRELSEVLWTPSAENPADTMTKENASGALMSLMRTNCIRLSLKSWVEHPMSTLVSSKTDLAADTADHREP